MNLRKDHNRFRERRRLVRRVSNGTNRRAREPHGKRPAAKHYRAAPGAAARVGRIASLGYRALLSRFKAFRPSRTSARLGSCPGRTHDRVLHVVESTGRSAGVATGSESRGAHLGSVTELARARRGPRAVRRSLVQNTRTQTNRTRTSARRNFRRSRTNATSNNESRKRNTFMTLNGGSLGSWIDEERSKVR